MEAHPLGWIAVLLYCAARDPRRPGACCDRSPFGRRRERSARRQGSSCTLPTSQLRARLLASVPYRTLGGSVSLFGWMLAIAYLALLIRHRERAIGPFLIPIVIVSSAIGLLLPSHGLARHGADARSALRPPRHLRDPRLRRLHVLVRPVAALSHPEPADPPGAHGRALRAPSRSRGHRTDEPDERSRSVSPSLTFAVAGRARARERAVDEPRRPQDRLGPRDPRRLRAPPLARPAGVGGPRAWRFCRSSDLASSSSPTPS